MRLLIRWLVNALTLLGITYYVPGIQVSSFYSALIAALVLGLVNALIRPLIILLTLPINILTLGLFTLVINAFLFWFTASIVKGFTVTSFSSAFIGALIMSVVSWLIGWLLRQE